MVCKLISVELMHKLMHCKNSICMKELYSGFYGLTVVGSKDIECFS